MVKQFKFHVNFAGDHSAGMPSYQEDVTVTLDEGIDECNADDFNEFLTTTLKLWYEGAKVLSWEELQKMVKADSEEPPVR